MSPSSCMSQTESGLDLFKEQDGSPDLFALYSGDLGERMFLYASGQDLCKLDSVNKQFKELTAAAWKQLAYERFGMRSGKEGWKHGMSLLREPIFIQFDSTPEHPQMYYMGSADVTAHNSLIAVITDDEGEDEAAPIGINLYDAKDMRHTGSKGRGGWRVLVAGPPGEETFITNISNCIRISRSEGDASSRSEEYTSFDYTERQVFPTNRNPHGIPMIGSEAYVIMVIGNILNLNKLPNEAVEDLVLCQSITLGRGHRNDDEAFDNSIAWGADRSTEFAVFHTVGALDVLNQDSDESEISLWRIDTDAEQMVRTQTICTKTHLGAIELTEDYVIGSCSSKMIHVWDRNTGDMMPYGALCDVDEEDQLDNDELTHPLQLSCHGHILVTTSHLGNALCIWNIRTGELLERRNNAEELRFADLMPNGFDVTSMTYWKHLNGFIVANISLGAWCFPMNREQQEAALKIRRRQNELRLQHHGDAMNEDDGSDNMSE
jgi:hypothetical protein